MKRFWPLALLLCGACAFAQAPDDPGAPRPGGALVDEEFGVASEQFGLRRQVEMAQWQRADGDYALVWSETPIDSAAFPPQYRNPGAFQLPGQAWRAEARMPDGNRLDDAALEALGEWRPLPPDADALPPNLAVTFQPDGDALTSAADPAAPQVGDLRIRWSERVLPPLQGRIALRDGVWTLADDVATGPADPVLPEAEGELRSYTPWIAGVLLLIAAIAVAVHHHRRRRRYRNPS